MMYFNSFLVVLQRNQFNKAKRQFLPEDKHVQYTEMQNMLRVGDEAVLLNISWRSSVKCARIRSALCGTPSESAI